MLLLACTGAEPDTAVEPVDSDPGPVVASLGVAEVQVGLQNVLDIGLPDARTVRDVFTSLFVHADDECPGVDDYALPADFDGCVAESGWTFAGVSTLTEDADNLHLWNDCLIDDNEGHRYTGGGHATWGRTKDGHVSTGIEGTFGLTDFEGWVGEQPSASFNAFGTETAESWWLVLDGGLSYGTEALWFSELIFDRQLCGELGSGELRYRGIDGWYTVTLTECTGCGPVTFETGELLDGEACVSVPAYDLLGRML